MDTCIAIGIAFAAFALGAAGFAQTSQPKPPKLSKQTGPLRIGVVGLVHGHVEGLLNAGAHRDDVTIVGVYEPDRALFDRMAAKYGLDASLYHADLEEMLDAAKPEAVSVMTSIHDHRAAVEACAPRGVHLLLEKPLAYTKVDARRMATLAQKHRVLVLTNYETSWYASVRQARRLVDSGEMTPIRRLVFRHGHGGPIELGCSTEFTDWLTDPDQNGGGALVDFGCYGAVLATWMMNGERPTRVLATASTLKPHTYPRVDDDATIVLKYPTATAIIQASWDWAHDYKEMDIYTDAGSIHTRKWNEMTTRAPNAEPKTIKPKANPPHLENEWTYLRKVIRGECEVDELSSLETNVIVAEILDQARKSVK